MATILLVEPDITLGAICKAALEHDGHKIYWRKTAESGIAAFDEQSIDLVVLELNMALHNGVEFLYEMRSYTDLSNIPVLLHTNVREKQISRAAQKDLGITKFLYKPATSLAQLRQAVQALMQPQT